MSSSLSGRDARRVVQVLVPGVPPPVLDYVFASITKINGGSHGVGDCPGVPPPTRYALRGCDGGSLWGLSLLESAASADGPLPPRRQSLVGELEFHYAPPVAAPPTTAPRRR